jgi:hypothetical protein
MASTADISPSSELCPSVEVEEAVELVPLALVHGVGRASGIGVVVDAPLVPPKLALALEPAFAELPTGIGCGSGVTVVCARACCCWRAAASRAANSFK